MDAHVSSNAGVEDPQVQRTLASTHLDLHPIFPGAPPVSFGPGRLEARPERCPNYP